MGIIVESLIFIFVLFYVLKRACSFSLRLNYKKSIFIFVVIVDSLYEGCIRNFDMATLLAFYTLQFVLILGATIDMQYYLLPNEGAISICIISLLHMCVCDVYIGVYIWQCICVFLFFCIVIYFKGNGIGGGDIKWLLALSLWYDTFEFIGVLTLSFVCGAFFGAYMKWNRQESTIIPFGPCIVIGSLWGHYYEIVLAHFF